MFLDVSHEIDCLWNVDFILAQVHRSSGFYVYHNRLIALFLVSQSKSAFCYTII